MRQHFFILFALAICINLFAQTDNQKYLDSLENRLSMATKDKEKADILSLLTNAYRSIDSIKTFKYGFEALSLSKGKDYKEGIMAANIALGGAFLVHNDLNRSQEYLISGTVIADSLMLDNPSDFVKKSWATGHYELGINYGYQGQNDKEIEQTDKVLPIVKGMGDSIFLARIHTNLGVKYLTLANYSDAYRSILQGNKIYKALNSPSQITFNQIQLATTLEYLDSLDRVREVLNEARTNLDRYPDGFDEYNYYLQENRYYVRIEQFEKALLPLKNALELVKGDENSIQYSLIMERYGRTYAELGNYHMAKKYITRFIELSKANGNGFNILKGYYRRSKFAAATKTYKQAYEDLSVAFDINDSLDILNTEAKLEELDLKYRTAEKEKEILGLRNQKNEANLALERQRSKAYFWTVIAIALVFLVLLGYLFYRNLLRKSRQKEKLKEAELQFVKQEQQNKIFSAMIEGQEKERKRLAIDLHDGLGGRLSGISLNLSKLEKDKPKEYPKEALKKAVSDLNNSLWELRLIARNLMPETLVKFGLKAALRDYCSSMSSKETKVTLQFYGSDSGLGSNLQVTIYRVIQELINNAIKHAKATEILVQCIREENTLNITVEDNGVGIPKEVLRNKNKGMGILNLQTRVAYLNGELDFQTKKDEGTTVNVQLEIDAA